MNLLESVLDLIFPKVCLECGWEGYYICPKCAKTIKIFDLPLCPGCMKSIGKVGTHTKCIFLTSLDGLYALTPHETIIKELIHQVKYRGSYDLLGAILPTMIQNLPKEFSSVDLFVYVPLHRLRRNERGFNQSEILAKKLSNALGKPLLSSVLEKIQKTAPQAHLQKRERLKNLRNVFVATRRFAQPVTVLLVDDVSTTGATLSECAKMLKKAGAKTVFGLVIAHGH